MSNPLAITADYAIPPDRYRYKYLIAIAVTLAAVLELIDTSIVNVAIPHMMGNLGATLDEISWVSTGYIIANVIVIPISGWLSAYFGRKRYITGSILLFVAASFFCGAAHSLGLLVFWRVVQGVGGGAPLSTAQAALFPAFPPHEIALGQAVLAVVSALSFVLLLWRELTAKEPVINFRVLKGRQLAAGVSIAAVLGFALYGSLFVLPIFLQGLHGLTANQTGLVILPGAIAAAFTMAFVGRNANRLDARATVSIGAVLFFASMWKLSRMTFVSGPEEMFWPLILRGVGLGLIFVPLTNASMAELKVRELAQGTGMFNLTRQLGGSPGIPIMATLLAKFPTQTKQLVTEHRTTMDPMSLGRLEQITRALTARGINPALAHQQALMVLDRQITAQASVLAFSKIYVLSGIVLLCSLPLLFLFRTWKGRGAMGPAH